MKVNTIGFTKKNASKFFGMLRKSGCKELIDVRLNNVSQLAGYAKKEDLKYFLNELCDMSYTHAISLAPTDDILKSYKSGDINWQKYSDLFLNLMARRNVEREFTIERLNNACLLCSENEPHFCHRRLVAEYIQGHSKTEFKILHLY